MSGNPEIFDRSLLRRRKQRTAQTFSNYDYLISEINQRLLDRLLDIRQDFPTVLEIGYPALARDPELQKAKNVETVISADLNADLLKQGTGHVLEADEEFLPFKAASFDLIIVNLSYHHVNDLPGALLQAKHALKPDGLLLASLFGGKTLWQLKQVFMETEIEQLDGATPHIIPFADIRDIGGLLQRAGLSLPVIDRDVITVNYRSPIKLFQDLQGMGQSNILYKRHKKPLARSVFSSVIGRYIEQFANDALGEVTVPADFEVLYLQGWSPHHSQQKPLQPGTGSVSFEDLFKPT